MWTWLKRLFCRAPEPYVWREKGGQSPGAVNVGPPAGVKVDRTNPYKRKGWCNFLILQETVDALGATSTKNGVSPQVVVRALFEMFERWSESAKKAFCWECLLRGVPDVPEGPIPDVRLTDLQEPKVRLQLEQLEDRLVPSTTLVDGVLHIDVANTAGVHTVSVDLANSGTQVQVVEDGRTTLFDRAAVNKLEINGAQIGSNIIQNNTNINSDITGGAKSDTLFGGSGVNVITPGAGKVPDIVYALLGVNTILADDNTLTYIFTNFNASVQSDDGKDVVLRFFAAHRLPGSGFIGVENGILYITPSNGGSYVELDAGKKPGEVKVIYDLDLSDGLQAQVQTFTGVKAVSFFGGTGSDFYVNDTKLVEAAYGSAGDDTLVGGFGKLSVLKGSGGNDDLTGRANHNDLSGNGGADELTKVGNGTATFRVDLLDAVFGAMKGDNFISP